jgi:glycosyltransferase involved in cell wall biosynthesis
MNIKKSINFIIIAYNEEENLKKLIPNLQNYVSKNIDSKKYNSKIILVDDGSTDNTLDYFYELEAIDEYDNIKMICSKNNHGKSISLKRAFEKTTSDYVILLDADLQDNLEDIQNIINNLEKGYDLVLTWRQNRTDSLLIKKIPSIIANLIYKIIFKINCHDFNCSLKGFKFSNALNLIEWKSGINRFITFILINELNYSYIEIKTTHLKRLFGKSKYNKLIPKIKSFFYYTYLILVKKHRFTKNLNK